LLTCVDESGHIGRPSVQPHGWRVNCKIVREILKVNLPGLSASDPVPMWKFGRLRIFELSLSHFLPGSRFIK
jgi:hypothetical protein